MNEPTTQPKAERAGEDESIPRTPKARTTAFTDTQIEAGFWLLASRAHPSALELDETRANETLFDTLKPLVGKNNLTRDKVKKAIAPILAVKEVAATEKLPQLFAARAGEVRKLILKEQRISFSKDALLWPTSSRMVAVRLGKGKWNDALTRLGLRASGRGRAQDSGRFNEAVMCTILTEFLKTTETTGLNAALGGYTSWSKEQRVLGCQDVSSTVSVRQRFGIWGKAMEFTSRTKEDSGQRLGQYRCASVFICPNPGSGAPMSVRNALPILVSLQPAGVYRLKQTSEDQTCGAWPLNIGQVYRTMRRLERTGCVTSHQETSADRDSEVFGITDAGHAILGGQQSTPVTREQPERDELVMKLTVVAADPSVDVASLVQIQRHATRAVPRETTHMNESVDDGEFAWKLILESHIFELKAESKWLDHTETDAISQASRRADFAASKRCPRRDTYLPCTPPSPRDRSS